jgi:hypothetical protein
MFSLLLLLSFCVGYYYLDMYYPRDTQEKIYVGGGVAGYILLIYFMNFQEEFIYKLFSQIKDIQTKPRYDLDFFYRERDKDFKQYQPRYE